MIIARRFFGCLARLLLAAVPLAIAAASQAQLAPPNQGTIRALLIGADHYKKLKTLGGAVADARDLEQALKNGGVHELTVLTEDNASRRQAEIAFNRLVADSRSGDLVIIAFAGHGSQLPERVKGSDPDGVDEVFVLPGFESTGLATAERILDKEINVWLKRIERKGAHTLFLADTCHGGGLTRQVDLRAGELSYRQATISIAPLDDALTPVSTAADRVLQPEEFDRVTFLAAADKWTKAPELRIPGQPTLRGGLSYALARALEGAADRNKDGKTTRRELFEYARQVVQQYSENRQVIYTEPTRRTDLMDETVFRGSGTSGQMASTTVDDLAKMAVRVAIVNGAASELAAVKPYLARIEVVDAAQQADVVWDVARGDVISRAGDVVARNIGMRDIADVLDRTAAITAITKLSEVRPEQIIALPNDKHHRAGEEVSFRAQGVLGKYVLLFNIASNGTIQFFYPIFRDDERRLSTPDIRPRPANIGVVPPFGADHVVAIVSDRQLAQLEEAIKAFDQTRAAGRIPAILRKHLASEPSVRIGVTGLFTVP